MNCWWIAEAGPLTPQPARQRATGGRGPAPARGWPPLLRPLLGSLLAHALLALLLPSGAARVSQAAPVPRPALQLMRLGPAAPRAAAAPQPPAAAAPVAPTPAADPPVALPLPLAYYPVNGLTVRPQALSEPLLDAPGLPPLAEGGRVRLRLRIDASGRVVAVEEVAGGSSLPAAHVAAARAAFLALRFSPGELAGRPVGSVLLVEVDYPGADEAPPAR